MGGPALSGVASAVASIERTKDIDVLRSIVRDFAGPLGYDSFVLYTAPPSNNGPNDVVEDLLLVEGDWFSGSDLEPETYLARCPVNRHVLETDRPFFWTKTGRPGRENYRVGPPRGAGVHGLQVPVFGATGLAGAMSFGGVRIDSSLEARLALTLVAVAALQTARRLASVAVPAAIPRL